MSVRGFSLVEVLVAMALVASSALGLAELFALASRVTQASRIDTVMTMAAETKMAELRGLPWAYDAAGSGAPLSDPGLATSPSSTLRVNTGGYVDFIDGAGIVVGTGTTVPRQGVYLRRWSILPLPADPAHTLVLQVVAAPVTRPAARDVHLISVLSRTAQ